MLRLEFLPTVLQIALITLLPIAIGMTLKQTLPGLVRRLNRFLEWLSIAIVVLVLAGMAVREAESFPAYLAQVGVGVLLLNLLTMGAGYAIATAAQLKRREAISITVEAGIQNATLAITVASAPMLLNNTTMAIPAIVYGTLMIFNGFLVAGWLGSRSRQRPKKRSEH